MPGRIVPEQRWLTIQDAAIYAGRISPEIIRRAVVGGELRAKRKPLTRGRKEGASRENLLVRISKDAIDEWIETSWEDAS